MWVNKNHRCYTFAFLDCLDPRCYTFAFLDCLGHRCYTFAFLDCLSWPGSSLCLTLDEGDLVSCGAVADSVVLGLRRARMSVSFSILATCNVHSASSTRWHDHPKSLSANHDLGKMDEGFFSFFEFCALAHWAGEKRNWRNITIITCFVKPYMYTPSGLAPSTPNSSCLVEHGAEENSGSCKAWHHDLPLIKWLFALYHVQHHIFSCTCKNNIIGLQILMSSFSKHYTLWVETTRGCWQPSSPNDTQTWEWPTNSLKSGSFSMC